MSGKTKAQLQTELDAANKKIAEMPKDFAMPMDRKEALTLWGAVDAISANLSSLYIARRSGKYSDVRTLVLEGVTANGLRVGIGGDDEPQCLIEALIQVGEQWLEYSQSDYEYNQSDYDE